MSRLITTGRRILMNSDAADKVIHISNTRTDESIEPGYQLTLPGGGRFRALKTAYIAVISDSLVVRNT